MAFDFGGVSNNSSNIFDSMFGGGASGGSNILGDYAAIKNGSYHKLLSSYYKETKGNESTEETDEDKEKKIDEKKALLLAKGNAEDLMKTSSELFKIDFASGKEYDAEDVQAKVKSFVEAYNKVIDSSSDVENEKVLSKALQMTKYVKENSEALAKVGIKVGGDNKLSFDEDAFKEVNASALDSVFNGRNSVLGSIGNKATQLFNLTGAAAFENNGASAYTNSGQYKQQSAYDMFNVMF